MIRFKVTIDKKTQQAIEHYRMASGGNLRVYGGLTPDAQQMLTLAHYGVALIRERVAQGVGVNDAPMPPLSLSKRQRWSQKQQRWVTYGVKGSGYQKWKLAHGLQPIRDLRGVGRADQGGHMLDNISVRSVSAREARIDITNSWARMKARTNQLRAPWYGWSPSDIQKLTVLANKILSHLADKIGAGIMASGRSFAPVWMAPWQRIAPDSVDARWATNLMSKIAEGRSLGRQRAEFGVSHPERRN